jgi:hypothetical protein
MAAAKSSKSRRGIKRSRPVAYAKYLSAEFDVWCNEVVRDHMEGRQAEPPRDVGIASLEAALRLLAQKVTELSMMADHRLAVAEYMSVRQALDHAKADPRGRRPSASVPRR